MEIDEKINLLYKILIENNIGNTDIKEIINFLETDNLEKKVNNFKIEGMRFFSDSEKENFSDDAILKLIKCKIMGIIDSNDLENIIENVKLNNDYLKIEKDVTKYISKYNKFDNRFIVLRKYI
ncbi:MAG TPA: hypothetical protein VKN74_03985 [Candidatus Mcinerneyibacterium sp.]|nr:hypothetical protein [Candidatus Mcinerneyibacterium sp.]